MFPKSFIVLVVFVGFAALAACQAPAAPAGEPGAASSAQPATTQAVTPEVETAAPAVTVPPATQPPATLPPAASPTPAENGPTPTTAAAPTFTAPAASATPLPAAPTQALAQASPLPAGDAVIVDHTSVDLFEKIPDEYLEKARSLRVLFVDQSVGLNLSTGLDCLAASSWEDTPVHCRRDYTGANWNWANFTTYESAPQRIRFLPDPVRYDRSRWVYMRSPGTWDSSIRKFASEFVPQNLNDYDIFSQKITYLMVADDSGITDPETGFFSPTSARSGWQTLNTLRLQHPDKTFFYWTSSLSRGIGSQTAVEFNEQMRQVARQEGLFLFDIADIESHTETGAPCYDNRDGEKYCTEAGKCEERPDDGLQILAICQDYTTETDGGHLGSVSAGKLRLAKAFWVLIAQIAGWKP